MPCRTVSSASAAADLLLFESPKRSKQEKGDPGIARQRAPCPALLAGLGPARTRTSMCSNIRAFSPSPAVLLGAMTGGERRSQSNGNSRSNNKSSGPAASGPLIFGAPVQRRRAGGIARRGARTMRARFRQYTDVLSKTPPARRVPAALPRARTWGGLLFGYLSLGHSRESNSAAAEADETLRSVIFRREKPGALVSGFRRNDTHTVAAIERTPRQ
jgi:hypothetical protein